MISKISHITLLVKDQDEALSYYTEKLGLEKRHDMPYDGMRWLTIGAKGQSDIDISLVKADKKSAKYIGKQAGEEPLLTFESSDCKKDYESLKSSGLKSVMEPKESEWGTEAILSDLYGNRIDLWQPKAEKARAAMKVARRKK